MTSKTLRATGGLPGEDLDPERARELLISHDQAHVLRGWDRLSPDGRESLLGQLCEIDWEWLARMRALSHSSPSVGGGLEPPASVIEAEDPRGAEAHRAGEDALVRGEVGVLVVAGGDGSRLGFNGPKALFPIGAVSGRTLLQLHLERVVALGRRYGTIPPLYVMTNRRSLATIERFLLAEARRYGYPAERLMIFPQGEVPSVDEDGRLLMRSWGELALAPNGNGGVFAGLQAHGALEHMERFGIAHLSYVQIDNPLARAADPAFVGFHLLAEAEFSCKVMLRRDPKEKVGVFARSPEGLRVVEYSEIPKELTTDGDPGELSAFRWANPGIFLWSRPFIERQAARTDMVWHRAHKRIAHLGQGGQLEQPASPNGYKFELFAMDTLPAAERTLLVETDRGEFAPVKNRQGEDSPETARAAMTALFREWINAAGGKIDGDPAALEISPLYAVDAEELHERLPPGFRARGDLFLASHDPVRHT